MYSRKSVGPRMEPQGIYIKKRNGVVRRKKLYNCTIGSLAITGQHLKLSPQSDILFHKVFFNKRCRQSPQANICGSKFLSPPILGPCIHLFSGHPLFKMWDWKLSPPAEREGGWYSESFKSYLIFEKQQSNQSVQIYERTRTKWKWNPIIKLKN